MTDADPNDKVARGHDESREARAGWYGPGRGALYRELVRNAVKPGTWRAFMRLDDAGRRSLFDALRRAVDEQERICERAPGEPYSPEWTAAVAEGLPRAVGEAWAWMPDAVRHVAGRETFRDLHAACTFAGILRPGRFVEQIDSGAAAWLARNIAGVREGFHKGKSRRHEARHYERGAVQSPGERGKEIRLSGGPEHVLSQLAEVALSFERALAGGRRPSREAARRLLRPEWEEERANANLVSLDDPLKAGSTTTHEDAFRKREALLPDAAAALDAVMAVRVAALRIARRARRGSARRWAARQFVAFRSGEAALKALAAEGGFAEGTLSEEMAKVANALARDPGVKKLQP